jgi:hypothetical protein
MADNEHNTIVAPEKTRRQMMSPWNAGFSWGEPVSLRHPPYLLDISAYVLQDRSSGISSRFPITGQVGGPGG